MARNDEVIRQWRLLRHLAAGRTNTINKLAEDLDVTTRTIRRDLSALQAAGFPIYDDTTNGTKFWRLDPNAMSMLVRNGLTFAELCALYFSRALLECFAGTEVLADLQGALDKFDAALTPQMKTFLNRLPRVINVKPDNRKRAGTTTYQTTSRLLQTIVDRTVLGMRYHSRASERDKDYVVHPYRLVYAQGGLYLMAFVPAYAEVRTFAVERIKRLAPQKATFTPVAELESDPFHQSLGVHRGPTCKVHLRFHPEVAASVRDKVWHASQQMKERADGTVQMTLQVCDDYALRSWILSFGRHVRVLGPSSLVEWARDEFQQAHEQYASGGSRRLSESDGQPVLPLLFSQLAGS